MEEEKVRARVMVGCEIMGEMKSKKNGEERLDKVQR